MNQTKWTRAIAQVEEKAAEVIERSENLGR
jgi:hypothetical protein